MEGRACEKPVRVGRQREQGGCIVRVWWSPSVVGEAAARAIRVGFLISKADWRWSGVGLTTSDEGRTTRTREASRVPRTRSSLAKYPASTTTRRRGREAEGRRSIIAFDTSHLAPQRRPSSWGQAGGRRLSDAEAQGSKSLERRSGTLEPQSHAATGH